MYDNGGKVIVCDPTCNDGVSDPSHCDCELNRVPSSLGICWRMYRCVPFFTRMCSRRRFTSPYVFVPFCL